MVSSRERVEAALALGCVDRPPVSAWGHTYADEWSPADLARVTVARTRQFKFDFAKLHIRETCFAEALGCVAEFVPGQAPRIVTPVVRSAADWAALGARSTDGQLPTVLREQVEAIRLVADELGPDVPVIQTVFSPLTVAGYLGRGAAQTVADLRDGATGIQSALTRISDLLIGFAQASIAAGAAGVFYAIIDLASEDKVSRDDYVSLALPFDQRVLQALPPEAWFNTLHLCGGRVFFDVASALPTNSTSWSIHSPGNPDLAGGLARSGKAVIGGVQRRTPADGSVNQVAAETRAALENVGCDGFMLAPGCSVSPWPAERADTMLAMVSGAGALAQGSG